MKKYLVLFCMFGALVACNKINEEINQSDANVVYKISINHETGDAATKAVKTSWETNDVVYIFFSNISTERYLKAQFNGASWSFTPMGGLTKADYAESGATATAVYFPFDQNNTPTYSDGWTFANTYYAYYLIAEKVGYTFTDNTMSLALDMSVPEGFVQFFLPTETTPTLGKYVMTESHINPLALTGVSADGTIVTSDTDGDDLTTRTAGYALTGYPYGDGYLFSGILAAGARDVETNYSISLVEQDPINGYAINTSVLKRTTTLYISNTGEVSYPRRALKLPSLSSPASWNTHKMPFVDLGIGDGLLWATGNLKSGGIAGPLEIGLFYTWGGKIGYDTTASSSTVLGAVEYTPADKYTGSGELVTAQDDAAYATNSNWRIPTASEVNFLINKTKMTKSGGRYGSYLGKNGIKLFVFDTGYYNMSNAYHINANMHYWTSSYGSSTTCSGWYIVFSSNTLNMVYPSWTRLQIAAQIRPVMPNS